MSRARVTDALVRAKKVIEDPSSWCRGACARDEGNLVVASHSMAACRWCAHGALLKAFGGVVTAEFHNCESLLCASLPETKHRHYMGYQDDLATRHADVMEMFDRAIALSRAGASGAGAVAS